ncbi:MAG: copper amine oxidase N-terminal domain-containing protein [Caldisericia bacterium]
MRKLTIFLTVLIIVFSLGITYAEYENPAYHGVWIEAETATFIDYHCAYTPYARNLHEYNFSASKESYLHIQEQTYWECDRITDGKTSLKWIVRDEVGIDFKHLWVSCSCSDEMISEISFSARNIEGFNNSFVVEPTFFDLKGASYGEFTWYRFKIPFNMKYAQPTTYELTMNVALDDIGIDVIYLSDGKYTPNSKSSPIADATFQYASKKLQIINPPLTTDFTDKLIVKPDDLVDEISTKTPAGVRHSFVIGINGGVDLGDVELINNFPLENDKGDKLPDIDFSIVSYMRKRFAWTGSVTDIVTSPEYLAPGNSAPIREGKTEFFWLSVDIPADTKPGIYKTRLLIDTEPVEDLMFPIEIEVLPYKVDINDFPEKLEVSKLGSVRVTDRIIFQSIPHTDEAVDKKITMDEAWKRWEADLEEISSHGFNCLVFKLPTIKSPIYFPDTEKLEKISTLAKQNNFKRLFVDITKMTKDAMEVEGKYFIEEFPRELDKIVKTVSDTGLEPVIFYYPFGFVTSQVELLHEAFDLMEKKPLTSASYDEVMVGVSNVDIPLYTHYEVDWIRETKNVATGNWVYIPRVHHGEHNELRLLSGVYSLSSRSPIMGLTFFNSPFGNAENDFDVMLDAVRYTPGDYMMVYTKEGYEMYPSLKWECFYEGLVDRALMDILLEKIANNMKSESSIAAMEFLKFIAPMNTTFMDVSNSFSPEELRLIRERLIDYIIWRDGGEKVENPSVKRDVIFKIGSKMFRSNGVESEMTVEPVIIDGSTFIPARYLVEPLGGTASWEGSTRTVILEALGHKVELVIDKVNAKSDGENVTLSRPPTIVNGRTLIPFRAASTLLGAEVSWNSQTREAICDFDLGKRLLMEIE